jgi:C_GCAxxG_C_C family probable redox protein
VNSKADKAAESFLSGFNCAQAVSATYAEEAGINREEMLKISCGLGAGMGRRQETCGAVTGAFLLIGCRHGNINPLDRNSVDKTYQLVRQFADRFAAKHGSISCKELLGCNLLTPEGQQYFKEHGFRESKCARYVHDSSEIIEDLLLNQKPDK